MSKNKWKPNEGNFGVFGGKMKSKGGTAWRPSKGSYGVFGRAKGSQGNKRKGKGGLFGKNKVQGLQQGLNENGATPPLKVDGQYGPKTKGAVDKFNDDNTQNIY